ncbi:MAG: hypothetical protein ACI3XG_04100, partial [Faecousia sp.]
MSIVKYRLKEVASDLGLTPKEIAEIIARFFEKPKSNTQILTDEELNVVFDCVTQAHQIDSLEQVFAAKPKQPAKPAAPAPQAAPAAEAPKGPKPQKPQNAPAPQAEAQQNTQNTQSAQSAKPKEPERKRERRIVDTSAVQVNSARFDDRVDSLISERAQNYQGGKQRIGGKKGQQ